MHNKELLPNTNISKIDFMKREIVEVNPVNLLPANSNGRNIGLFSKWAEVMSLVGDHDAVNLTEKVREVVFSSLAHVDMTTFNGLADQAASVGMYGRAFDWIYQGVTECLSVEDAEDFVNSGIIPREASEGFLKIALHGVLKHPDQEHLNYFPIDSRESSEVQLQKMRNAAAHGILERDFTALKTMIYDDESRNQAEMIYGLYSSRRGEFHKSWDVYRRIVSSFERSSYSIGLICDLYDREEFGVAGDFLDEYMDWMDDLIDGNGSDTDISNGIMGLVYILPSVKDEAYVGDIQQIMTEFLHDERRHRNSYFVELVLDALIASHATRNQSNRLSDVMELAEKHMRDEDYGIFEFEKEVEMLVYGGGKEVVEEYVGEMDILEDKQAYLTTAFHAAMKMEDYDWVYENLYLLDSVEDEMMRNGESYEEMRLSGVCFVLAKKFVDEGDSRYEEVFSMLPDKKKVFFLHSEMRQMIYGDWMSVLSD